MTLSVKHKFNSLKVDGGDTSLIRPSNWNDEHNLEGKAWSLPFRAAGTAGAMTDVALGDGLFYDATSGKLDVKLTGLVAFFAFNSAPTGFLQANGAAISRTTYATLFAAIGTTFGAGDGSTTFNVPDMRGVFARGMDNGRGLDVGRVFGSYQDQQNQVHNHGVTDGSHAHSVYDPTHAHGVYDPGHTHAIPIWNGTSGRFDGPGGNGVNTVATYTNANGAGTGIGIYGASTGISIYAAYSNITIQNSGGENHPRNVSLMACIKY